MVELLGIAPLGWALVAAGAVLLFAGAALSVYGVGLLGALLGGGAGYLAAPTIGGWLGIGGGIGAVAAAVAIGVVVGVVVAYSLLSMVVAAAGFVVGVFLGQFVVTPLLVDGPFYVEWGATLGVGIVCGFFGMMFTKTSLIGITSFLGSALAARQLTMADFRAAADGPSIDPLLFDYADPIFLVLLVLGALSQIGLFKLGYVTKITALLPGADVLTDRGEDEERAAGGG